ncbi:hypothetical protein [Putridiphycobacter roseus]|nr:hypothetical protein [Putridiphycobacter roseus]
MKYYLILSCLLVLFSACRKTFECTCTETAQGTEVGAVADKFQAFTVKKAKDRCTDMEQSYEQDTVTIDRECILTVE